MGSEEHVCPDCGQPVETVVRRHKTLGAWVPTWVAGPCRNPDCSGHSEEPAEQRHHDRPAPPGQPSPSAPPGQPAPAGRPEKTTATES
ncbi:hypothetical protein ACFV46_18225 [Streptomyces sp. NPDC059852]|uniref:hypothetical protein n=1 Tax=Streptomyces sp. NPDC059852 TaxID=3346972 RepID=UPI00365A6C91